MYCNIGTHTLHCRLSLVPKHTANTATLIVHEPHPHANQTNTFRLQYRHRSKPMCLGSLKAFMQGTIHSLAPQPILHIQAPHRYPKTPCRAQELDLLGQAYLWTKICRTSDAVSRGVTSTLFSRRQQLHMRKVKNQSIPSQQTSKVRLSDFAQNGIARVSR